MLNAKVERIGKGTIAVFAVIAAGCAIYFSAHFPRSVVPPPREGGGEALEVQDASALLAKYYPAKSAASSAVRHFPIAPVADGFAPADMQPSLTTPGSRWQNPAKTVQPVFPRTFNNPVRVRCSTADVSAVPENANPASSAVLNPDGSIVYADAFGPGIDVLYRCEPLKTEEFIVIRCATGSLPLAARATSESVLSVPSVRQAQLSFPLPLREGVGGGVKSFSWQLDTHGFKPRLTPAHTIELCDTQGVPRLRINAPEGKDASGKLLRAGHELRITLDGNRVTLAADTRGLDFPIVIDPTWSSTGSMGQSRAGDPQSIIPSHATERLPDGRVLVSGGYTLSGASQIALSSCELFDPQTETWAATGSMNVARQGHKLLRLLTGKMLVAGSVSNCELYDPATGLWTSTGSSISFVDAAVVMNDGRVLATDGTDAEIYDPGTEVWTATGSLNVSRTSLTLTVLADGRILAVAGYTGTSVTSSCEIFDPTLGTWTSTGSLAQARFYHATVLLGNGAVLVCAGSDQYNNMSSAELFNPSTGTWAATGSLKVAHMQPRAVVIGDRVLIAGGATPYPTRECELYAVETALWSDAASLSIEMGSPTLTLLSDSRALIAGGNTTCEIFDPRLFQISGHSGTPIQIDISSELAHFLDIASFTVNSSPANGSVSSTSTSITYTSIAGYLGTDSFTYQLKDSLGNNSSGTVNITLTNSPPGLQSVSSSVTPANDNHLIGNQPAAPNQVVTFTATATDPDDDPLTYTWDFADGTPPVTGQSVTHSYPEVGTYLAKVTVTDPAGAAAITGGQYYWSPYIQVLVSEPPIARMQTSDVVAFATAVFTFDASTSTDPENSIASYDWDFGDGTPHGSGQSISKIYKDPGAYKVTLTVTDSAGVSTQLTRVIEVLSASEQGLFGGFMNYKVSWNRQADSKDSLSFASSVNVGDDVVGKDTPVAFEIAGQRFTGTLDLKQRDYTDPNVKWQLKAGIRGQPSGTVSVKLKIKNADLGLGFNLLGVTKGGDAHDIVSKEVPVHLEVGGRIFELLVPSDFKFNSDGTKARGDGESD